MTMHVLQDGAVERHGGEKCRSSSPKLGMKDRGKGAKWRRQQKRRRIANGLPSHSPTFIHGSAKVIPVSATSAHGSDRGFSILSFGNGCHFL